MIRVGVTGTDTAVGKTIVAAALLASLRERGLAVAAMKPVETGVAADDPAADAFLLRAAAGGRDPLGLVRPLAFAEPLAPHLAAERAGRPITLEALDSAFRTLSLARDAVVVEGAGGLLVPLTRTLAFDTLFRHWALDLVLVGANRLGVVNHTRLTLRAAEAAGLVTRCVVLNRLGPEPDDLAVDTNAALLRDLLPEVPVITFPRLEDPTDLGALARAAEESGLVAAVLAGREALRGPPAGSRPAPPDEARR